MKKLKPIICILMICATFLLSFLTFSPVANVGAISGDWSSYTSIPTEEGGCFLIGTAQELSWFNQNKNNEAYRRKNVKLTANIDLSAHYWSPTHNGSGLEQNWGAVFDGNGYKISGLTTSSSGTETYAGLFSYTYYGTTIKNVIFRNCSVSGTHTGSGIVAGYFDGTTITACHFYNCTLNVTISDGSLTGAGGIVGFVHASNFSYCYMTNLKITATGTTNRVGGIVGYQYNSNVSTCAVNLNADGITVTGTTNYVGGVTGELYNTAPTSGTYSIQKSYSECGQITAGNTSSTTSSAGGICGVMRNGCKIENCYSRAGVSANAKTTTTTDSTFYTYVSSAVLNEDTFNYDYYIVGGSIIDDNAKGTYKNTKYSSTIKTYQNQAYGGGVCGYAATGSSLSYCYYSFYTSDDLSIIYSVSSTGESYKRYELYFKMYYRTIFSVHYFDYQGFGVGATSKNRIFAGGILGYRESSVTVSNCYTDTYPGSSSDASSFLLVLQVGTHSISSGKLTYKSDAGNTVYTQTIENTSLYNNYNTTTSISDVETFTTDNSGVWVTDSKFNDGQPIIRDFHWQHSATPPA